MKRKIYKKLFCLFIAPILLLIFSSCSPDLGKYELEKGFDDYYKDYGKIECLYEDSSGFKDKSYDLDDLVNEYTINNLEWEKEEDSVLFLEYVYIIIPIKHDITIQELGIYFKADPNAINSVGNELEISLFYFPTSGNAPSVDELKKMNDPDTRIVKDLNNNDVEEVIEYGDPKKEDRISFAKLSSSHDFQSILIGGFHQTVDYGEAYITDSKLNAKEGSFLYLRVENNSALNRSMIPVAITFINLLIKAE
jgi:hypothetical protein